MNWRRVVVCIDLTPQEDLHCFEGQDLGPCASRSPEIRDCFDIVAKQGDRLVS